MAVTAPGEPPPARSRVGPFRALLMAHTQTGWNRMRKGMGRGDAWGMGILLSLIGGVLAILFFIAFAIGYGVGHHLDKPLAPLGLGFFLATVPLVFGATGGVLGGTRQLTWDAYRGYPLRFSTLFSAEMAAGLGDVIAIAMAGFLASLGVGFALVHPFLAPVIAFQLAQSMIWMLCVQQLIGGLAAAVVKRLRVALVALGLAAWAGAALIGTEAERLRRLTADRLDLLRSTWNRLLPFLEWAPSVKAARGLSLLGAGEVLRGAAYQLPMLATTAALVAITYAVLRREARPTGTPSLATTGSDRGFRFTHPVHGLARLHLHHLTSSMQGRFGMFVPLITLVLIKGPLAQFTQRAPLVSASAFMYLAVTTSQLVYNQFGFDGQGVKTLLLMPVEAKDILLAKALGLAAYHVVQAAVLAALLEFLVDPSAADLAGAVLLGATLFVAQTTEGHWISALYPRALPFHRVQGGGFHSATLIPLGISLLNVLFFGSVYALLGLLSPVARTLSMLALLALAIALYRALLPRAARFVVAQRERLVEVLG